MELAIQCAALEISEKPSKKVKKKTKCNTKEIKLQLEESKSSPLIRSPMMHKRNTTEGRRIGVSEVNHIDRVLVKQSLKNYNKTEKIDNMMITD